MPTACNSQLLTLFANKVNLKQQQILIRKQFLMVYTPDTYKISVTNTLLNRCFLICCNCCSIHNYEL